MIRYEVRERLRKCPTHSHCEEDFDTIFFEPVMLVSSKGDGRAKGSKDFAMTWFAFGSEVRTRSPRADKDSVYVLVELKTETRGPLGRILHDKLRFGI